MRRVLATVLLTCAMLGIACAPAWAAGNSTVVEPIVDGVRPALPAGSMITTTAEGELAAAATSDVPLAVAAPDGRDFLRISARGVDLDAAHPFTYQSRTQLGVTAVLPDGVVPGAPPRWVHVSAATSWHWFDARVWPATAAGAPAGGRAGTTQVLAAWAIPLRQGADTYTADGHLERREPTGALRTTADPAPSGLSAVVAPGSAGVAPSLVLQGTPGPPLVVLGLDDEPFLRRVADGSWQAESGSRTYRLGLLRAGQPVPRPSGWVPYAAAGPVGWADDRLAPPDPVLDAASAAATPADVWRWQVPVLVADRREAVTGSVRYDPGPGAAGGSGSAALPLWGLGGVVLALGAGLVLLVRRHRRLAADVPDTRPDPRPDAALPPREGAPLP